MNARLSRLSLVVAAALLGAAASAHAMNTPDAAAAERIEIVAPRAPAQPAPAALRGIDASYRMSDGRVMTVTDAGSGETLLVRWGRRSAEHRLAHDGHGNFVSPGGLLSLRLDLDAEGEPSTARLTMPAGWR